ncbi:MAG: twin-arginine translocation signal domain-containing protein [Candidatus Nanohaloarchaea archaeon]|nr:twin-arginine translocation signal domain-containing protein [Candidatus Nanohaloarchaea archaeon]
MENEDKSEEGVSRRRFLQMIGAAAIAGPAAAVYSANLPKSQDTTIKRENNCAKIYRPEGTYSVVYGTHTSSQDYDKISQYYDGVFFEINMSAEDNYLEKPLEALYGAKEYEQYKELFKKIEEYKVPVYFSDVELLGNIDVGNYSIPLDSSIGVLEALTGGDELKEAFSNNPKEASRRELIGTSLKKGVNFAAGLWLLTPILSSLAQYTALKGGFRSELTSILKKYSSRLHPEINLISNKVRNAVISYKQKSLMKENKDDYYANFIGGDHTVIEDFLEDSQEEGRNYIESTRPFWKHLVVPETIYKTVKFEYTGTRWKVDQIHENQELKKITID